MRHGHHTDAETPEIPINFLGKGPNAIVREGCVLVAPQHEHNTYLQKSAIFIHAMGVDSYGEHVTRGVVIDHPTAFTMGEMSAGSVVGSLAENILFRGGDCGADKAMMLHSAGALISSKKIGTSGIYEGGLRMAIETVEDGDADIEEFKFFFNYVEFTVGEMESMMNDLDSNGDTWMSVEVSPSFVLDGDLNRAEAWNSLRKRLKVMAE